MDDMYDDASSSSSPSSSSPLPRDPSAPPNPVTVASASPHQILTLALPIQPPAAAPGRDDCWSEGATSALIDAWGERYLQLSRGNLRQKQWQDVADAVSSRDDYSKPPKTDAQCKNRIDTLKKKYKAEKSKPAASCWAFFQRLDFLLGPTLIKPSPAPAAVPKRQRTNFSLKRKLPPPPPPNPSTPSSSTSDSFPPAPNGKMRELARAIRRFGEVYQRVESSKMEQWMEMERQRMEFSREVEEQRMHFFMKAQIELSQIKRRGRRPSSGSGPAGANNHRERRRHGHQAPGSRIVDGNQNLM